LRADEIQFAFVPVFYFFYPETSNKSLEDIDFLFAGGTSGLPRLPFTSHTTPASSDIEKGSAHDEVLKKSETRGPIAEHVEKN
jgi:hypothetical protein